MLHNHTDTEMVKYCEKIGGYRFRKPDGNYSSTTYRSVFRAGRAYYR